MSQQFINSLLEPLKKEFTLIKSESFEYVTSRGVKKTQTTFGICYDYNKDSNRGGNEVTGASLYINNTGYAVVDVDVHVEDEDEEESVRDNFMEVVEDMKVKVVKTRGGGLHIYCRWDESLEPNTGRAVGVYESEDGRYAIDVMSPVHPDKASLVLMPGSKAEGRDGKRGRYELIQSCPDDELSTLTEVVKVLEEEKLVNFDAVRHGGKLSAHPEKKTKRASAKKAPEKATDDLFGLDESIPPLTIKRRPTKKTLKR